MRKLLALFGFSAVVIALVASALPAEGAAGTTECTSTLAPGSYQRVVVPAGAVCLSQGPVTIRAGLWILSGATFALGNDENTAATGTIGGGVHARDAASVEIQFDVTFSAIEDNVIHGGATVSGYDGFWFGFIRNHVSGTVRLSDNVLADPDGNEYVTNVIHGSLMCWSNSPAPQVGDSEGLLNDVTGAKTGQCSSV